jgi:hypothetical protein
VIVDWERVGSFMVGCTLARVVGLSAMPFRVPRVALPPRPLIAHSCSLRACILRLVKKSVVVGVAREPRKSLHVILFFRAIRQTLLHTISFASRVTANVKTSICIHWIRTRAVFMHGSGMCPAAAARGSCATFLTQLARCLTDSAVVEIWSVA